MISLELTSDKLTSMRASLKKVGSHWGAGRRVATSSPPPHKNPLGRTAMVGSAHNVNIVSPFVRSTPQDQTRKSLKRVSGDSRSDTVAGRRRTEDEKSSTSCPPVPPKGPFSRAMFELLKKANVNSNSVTVFDGRRDTVSISPPCPPLPPLIRLSPPRPTTTTKWQQQKRFDESGDDEDEGQDLFTLNNRAPKHEWDQNEHNADPLFADKLCELMSKMDSFTMKIDDKDGGSVTVAGRRDTVVATSSAIPPPPPPPLENPREQAVMKESAQNENNASPFVKENLKSVQEENKKFLAAALAKKFESIRANKEDEDSDSDTVGGHRWNGDATSSAFPPPPPPPSWNPFTKETSQNENNASPFVKEDLISAQDEHKRILFAALAKKFGSINANKEDEDSDSDTVGGHRGTGDATSSAILPPPPPPLENSVGQAVMMKSAQNENNESPFAKEDLKSAQDEHKRILFAALAEKFGSIHASKEDDNQSITSGENSWSDEDAHRLIEYRNPLIHT